jgi:hypothetical protein
VRSAQFGLSLLLRTGLLSSSPSSRAWLRALVATSDKVPQPIGTLGSSCDVTNAPVNEDPLPAVTYADGELTAVFDTPAGTLETQINEIQEQCIDGVDYTVWGRWTSSNLRGAHFTAVYNCESRTSRPALKQAT